MVLGVSTSMGQCCYRSRLIILLQVVGAHICFDTLVFLKCCDDFVCLSHREENVVNNATITHKMLDFFY
jgi:hypothetical protein